MSAQHTPGPWAVQDIGLNCLRITANMPLENIPQHVGADEAIWDAINVDLQQVLDDVSCWEGRPAERVCGQLEAAINRLNAAVGHEREGYEAAIASSFELERLHEQRNGLIEALRTIANGEVIGGGHSHIDTVLTYQNIARAAIQKAEGK
jgi:hypothetical protein